MNSPTTTTVVAAARRIAELHDVPFSYALPAAIADATVHLGHPVAATTPITLDDRDAIVAAYSARTLGQVESW